MRTFAIVAYIMKSRPFPAVLALREWDAFSSASSCCESDELEIAAYPDDHGKFMVFFRRSFEVSCQLRSRTEH
jgi:hypothetical protein